MTAPLSTGLFVCPPHAEPIPVPLEHVAVHGRLVGASAEVTLTQRFRNDEPRPIEAVYVFPLPSEAAVTGFSATIGDRVVEGHVEEREKAFELYDDALAEGHGAYLLDSERPNIFTMSVGNLPPGQTVGVTLRWVVRCAREGEAVRFQLPTTVSPRYVPAHAPQVAGQPDAERINPPREASVPYGLELVLRLEGGRPRRVASPTHPIDLSWLPDGAEVRLGQDVTALDRDVVILVEPEAASRPEAIVACDASGQRFVQVEFIPTMAKVDSGHEVVFVVDCSGSMDGDSMDQARRALELCIRALGERDTFDIVRFGSSYDALFGRAELFHAASLERAVRHLAATSANMGGTEILPALAAITARPVDPLRPRQILLLTDGQVSNEAEVIAHAASHAERARIFAFGIGAGVSEHLVRELARATRGQVEMIVPGERIEPKVLRQFGRLRTPSLGGVTLDWGGLVVTQAPAVVPPIFEGDPLTVWARVEGGHTTKVVLRSPGQSWEVPVDLERAAPATGSGTGPVPAVWARTRIRELENEPARGGSAQSRGKERASPRDRQLIELGKQYGLLSSLTSYVAVELRAAADRTREAAALRQVPIALTAGWGGTAKGGTVAPRKKHAARPPAMPAPAPVAPTAPAPGGPQKVYAQRSMSPPSPQPSEAPSFAGSASGSGAASPRDGARMGGRPAPAGPPPATVAPAAFTMDLMESEAFERTQSVPLKQDAAFDGYARGAAGPSADSDDGSSALYDVLLTQAADGHFAASPALNVWIGGRQAAFATLLQRLGVEVAWTLAALAYFEAEAPAQADEWRAAADKARTYLARAKASLDLAAFRTALGA